MRYTPVIQSAAIVMVGRFNPAIFSPGWLLHVAAIGESEFNSADTRIIHPDISDLSIGHLTMNVTPDKFQIMTSHEPFIQLLDKVLIMFKKNLIHTPITKVGINLSLHFELNSRAQQVALGRKLAPLEPWGAWGKRLDTGDLARVGGLRGLVMEESKPEGREWGFRRVDLQPSTQVNPHTGVYIGVNDHYELGPTVADPGASTILSLLEDNFELSLECSREIISDLMEYAAGIMN
jgi:hypothetical protein